MIPRLYSSNETAFTSMGICPLADAISCTVTEERNGQYTLELVYPVSGQWFSELKVDRIILAQAHESDTHPQPFRIESIEGDIGPSVTIQAVHISYQLNWMIIGQFEKPVSSGTRRPSKFWTECNNHLMNYTTNPFTFSTDLDDVDQTIYGYGAPEATPLRTMLGGMEGSMLDIWHGEFEWDVWTVKYWKDRGEDNGIRITYGKNLTGIDWSTDVSETYTSVVAFWKQDNEGTISYVESGVNSVGTNQFAFQRTIVVDASGDFQNQPTVAQLNSYAAAYVKANAINPTVSVSIDFVPLWQTEEYKDYAAFEKVGLCDAVTIVYPPLNLELKAQVVKTVYNVFLDRYDSIEISTVKKSLADTIFAMQKEIESL